MNDFGLLEPNALYLAGLVPVLALAYLLRERRRRVVVSSVLAFRALRAMRPERSWRRFRPDWTFLTEALLILLGALVLAGPYRMVPHTPVALVLDNSALMQAKTPSGPSRFELARSRALAALKSAGDQVTVYVTAPRPHLLATTSNDGRSLAGILAGIQPVDAPDDLAAVAQLVADLATSHRFARIVVASGHPIDLRSSKTRASNLIDRISVGEPQPNLALGAVVLRREVLGSGALEARVTLGNFTPQPANPRVTISDGKRVLAEAEVRLSPRDVSVVDFQNLPERPFFEVRLEPEDAFPLDNVAYATADGANRMRILFVSPRPEDAAGLEKIRGVEVRAEKPETYRPEDSATADLVIFEFTEPKEFPRTNALLVLPPGGALPMRFRVAPMPAVKVSSWRSPDPLTDGVNFLMLKPMAGEYFAPHPWMDTVVEGEAGGLVLSGSRAGNRYVAVGFNLFPYLGRKNLPISILTLNAFSYLGGMFSSTASFRTGAAWRVPAGVEKIVAPGNREFSVKPGELFTETAYQGIYKLIETGGHERLRAVNLGDLRESDLESVERLELAVDTIPPSSHHLVERRSFGRYLLYLIVLLAALEALLIYRGRTRGAPA